MNTASLALNSDDVSYQLHERRPEELHGGSMNPRGTNSRSHTHYRTSFCKQSCCPSSEELLRFCQRPTLFALESRKRLHLHLDACDFCAAEAHLLATHPPQNTISCAPTQIPVHLYALARALLTKPLTSVQLVEAIHATAGLTLTDA
jgi:hypothetical protein